MSERIRELAIQVMHSDPEPHLSTELFCFTTSEFEKFSELVVKECVSLIRYMGNPTYINSSDWEVSRNDAMSVIREHFGVEE